ncbi:MAG: cell division ATPase MinD [Nanoarchaeota archaeon]|nr:cell division ATPase MinD [Nanoarchaeota archaeon]
MRILGLLSGKGGVGKTSSSINLGAALNHFGKDVIVIDGNLSTPNVGLHLGVPTVPINFHDVLKGKNKINESLYSHPSGLKFIPGSLSISDMQGLNLKKFGDIRKLDADFILLDGAAGLGGEAIKVMENSDELIIVTNPELPALTDALKTIKLAEELGKDVLGVLVTRVKKDDLDISIRNVEALLERPVLGVIGEDDNIRVSLSMKDAVVHTHPSTLASKGYFRLAANIAGVAYSEPTQEHWARKIWQLIWKQ